MKDGEKKNLEILIFFLLFILQSSFQRNMDRVDMKIQEKY